MVLGNFQTHLENSRARLTVLAVSAGGVVWTFFSPVMSLFSLGDIVG